MFIGWYKNSTLLSIVFSCVFSDEAREAGAKLLVHCQAGVSRSATITIAFLLQHSRMTMTDAYRFTKAKRQIISPNFNFMGQLLDFEQALNQGRVPRVAIPTMEEIVVCLWVEWILERFWRRFVLYQGLQGNQITVTRARSRVHRQCDEDRQPVLSSGVIMLNFNKRKQMPLYWTVSYIRETKQHDRCWFMCRHNLEQPIAADDGNSCSHETLRKQTAWNLLWENAWAVLTSSSFNIMKSGQNMEKGFQVKCYML